MFGANTFGSAYFGEGPTSSTTTGPGSFASAIFGAPAFGSAYFGEGPPETPAVIEINAPFIGSSTVVYAAHLDSPVEAPFIGSVTVVYTPTLLPGEIYAPFIASKTHVWDIFSMFDPDKTFLSAGSPGSEKFLIRLAPNGGGSTATLAADMSDSQSFMYLTGDGGFPTDRSFVVTIDNEVIYIGRVDTGHYRAVRAMSNTSRATHGAGATVTWGDSYDMPIVSGVNINESFTASIESTPSFTYPGWLMEFDCSQAYLADGTRVPMHVTSVLGVFAAGAGSGGANKCDAAQPNAVSVPVAASDHAGAALSNPARIQTDIVPGDVALCRYTNPLAQVLDLGPRSTALQSWFGMMRVDTANADVTFTDPNGIIVDTTGTYDTFTASIEDDYDEPLALATGIARDASDAVGHAVATPGTVPWMTDTMLASARHFTRTAGGRDGWPIGVVTVRQANRRVPYWQSWDWHNYSYVYSGFGPDDTFAQIIINRNGIVFGPLPTFDLPNDLDIQGPDVYWDDATYFFSFVWYVVLFNGPYLVEGPIVGGVGGGPIVGSPTPEGGPTPAVTFPGGTSTVVVPTIEGGSGGGFGPTVGNPIMNHSWRVGHNPSPEGAGSGGGTASFHINADWRNASDAGAGPGSVTGHNVEGQWRVKE